jgi:hypothetical protein
MKTRIKRKSKLKGENRMNLKKEKQNGRIQEIE